jgi:hypothetical protein
MAASAIVAVMSLMKTETDGDETSRVAGLRDDGRRAGANVDPSLLEAIDGRLVLEQDALEMFVSPRPGRRPSPGTDQLTMKRPSGRPRSSRR